MFRIKTMNSISPAGIEALTARGCDVSADEVRPEALLLRSAELHGCEFNPELLAIGRAGAGYNNIPIPDCTEPRHSRVQQPRRKCGGRQGAGAVLARDGVA